MAEESKNPFSRLFSRLPVKLPGAGHHGSAHDPKSGISDLKLVFFIVDWDRLKVISEVFEKDDVGFHFISKGSGTASSEVLHLLGIGASDKAVVICLEQPTMVPILLQGVRKKLGFNSPGAGIAFTVPLSGINGPILRVFNQPDKNAAAEATPSGHKHHSGEYANELIVSVVNQGCCDELMNTARKVGALGGTVLNARGRSGSAVKLFGISVQDEKELILILSNREKREPIMRAIYQAHGQDSHAQGIVFSMPVDNVMSLAALQ